MYVLQFTSDAVADVKTVIPKHLKSHLQKELLEKVASDPVGCSHELQGDWQQASSKDGLVRGQAEALQVPLAEGYPSFTWQQCRVVYKVFDEVLAIAIVGVGLRAPQSAENIYRKLEVLAQTGKLAQGVLFSLGGFTKGDRE